jgi:hypothetical protein
MRRLSIAHGKGDTLTRNGRVVVSKRRVGCNQTPDNRQTETGKEFVIPRITEKPKDQVDPEGNN